MRPGGFTLLVFPIRDDGYHFPSSSTGVHAIYANGVVPHNVLCLPLNFIGFDACLV